jgi:hypothetical protein
VHHTLDVGSEATSTRVKITNNYKLHIAQKPHPSYQMAPHRFFHVAEHQNEVGIAIGWRDIAMAESSVSVVDSTRCTTIFLAGVDLYAFSWYIRRCARERIRLRLRA